MKALKWIAIVLGVLLFLLATWGMLIEPRFILDETNTEVEIPNLPSEWDGKRVAFFADLQVGMWFDNTGMVEKVVSTIIEQRPDLILIGGDFVYKPDPAKIDEAIELLRPLAESGIPVYAVLGNHDYSMMKKESEIRQQLAAQIRDGLEDLGIEVLQNEVATLQGLNVIGIGSEWADNSNPAAALGSIATDEPRIIFMHNPVAFRDLEPETAPLALAAHTHGGQIRLPLFESESWLDIAREREVVADGWAEDGIGAAGNRLYVNRGIGFSLVPIRFMCPPELTTMTLRSADGPVPDRG